MVGLTMVRVTINIVKFFIKIVKNLPKYRKYIKVCQVLLSNV